MIDIEKRHLDSHNRQHNFVLIATLHGTPVGSLSFVEFEGSAFVWMISVSKDERRQGIGTELVLALQRQYPERPITFGWLTDDGACLLGSLEWDVRPNETHHFAASRLAVVERKLDDYSARAEALCCSTQSEKDVFTRDTADWNDLHNEADLLRETVDRTEKEFRFVVGRRQSVPEPSPGLSP
jgi:GNAT superfamily N-acetyltransferase